MNKNIIDKETVAASVTKSIDISPALPAGKIWVVSKFGGGVPDLNDGYSGNIILRLGTTVIRALTLKGTTREIDLNKDVIGDGTSMINIVFQNPSTVDKDFFYWIDAFER